MLLNGQQVGTSETQADGQVTVTGDVPARLAAGETNLQLRVPLTDTAVAGSETTTTAEITEAQTELSLETNVSRTDAPTANLTGSLQLAGGRPIGGQDLSVFVEGQQVDTVTTAADGRYQATIATDDLDVESSSPTVRVAFSGSETHLAASDATATLELQEAVSDTSGGEDTVAPSWADEFSLRQLGLVGVSILIVGLLFGLLVRTTDWNPGGLLGASDPADSGVRQQRQIEPMSHLMSPRDRKHERRRCLNRPTKHSLRATRRPQCRWRTGAFERSSRQSWMRRMQLLTGSFTSVVEREVSDRLQTRNQ